MRLLTFENVNLVDTTTGFDSISASGVSRDTSAPLKSTASFYVNRTGNTADALGKVTVSGQNELYVSFYLRLDALPGTSSTPRIVRIVNSGSATTGNIVISGNKLQLRNNSTTIGTAATALSANTTYRVVIHQKKGAGNDAVLEAWYAEGDTTLALFAQKTDATFTTTTVDVSIGTTNSQALQARFDNIDIDTGVLPGPSASVRNQYVAQVNATSIPVVAQAKPAHSVTKSYGNVAGMPLQQTTVQTRTVTYGYDGLNRLTSTQESGLITNSYTEDAQSRVTGYNCRQRFECQHNAPHRKAAHRLFKTVGSSASKGPLQARRAARQL